MAEMQDSVSDVDFRVSGDTRSHTAPLAVLMAGVRRRRLDEGAASLRAIVEAQVVPRLHAAHRKDLRQTPPATILPIGGALDYEVSALGDRLLLSDQRGACDRIDALRIEGRSLECIYLDLLAPTASYIRRLWSEDLCDFAGATLALVTLQAVVRQFAPAFRAEQSVLETGHRALLASPLRTGVDGATAMFGLVMVSEFFRRSGWESWIEPDVSSAAFGDTVKQQWFDVVEILASSDRQLDGIASSIRTIRRGSANRGVGVIVCGQIFIDHPEFVRLVGADLPSSDARACIQQAKQFVSLPIPSALVR